MFQPQPIPFAFAYGAGGIPNYSYNQQQQANVLPATYFGGAGSAGSQGLQQVGGVVSGAGGAGGNYGPASGFGGAGRIGVSGAASGPAAGATVSLLFTSHASLSNNYHNTSHHGPQHGRGHIPNNYHPHRQHQQQQGGIFHGFSRQRTHHHAEMESDHDLSADLAAQQEAARDYQPQLEGPLVGDMTPTTAITEAYCLSDPTFVEKTRALPEKYSHYRPIQGDGNCGWRAIAFGYLEALIRTGNAQLVGAERDRLVQFAIPFHQEMLYEDMREELATLMSAIEAALPDQKQAMNRLVEGFNDPNMDSPIIYYLRLLASSFLSSDPVAEQYYGFIPHGMGAQAYCKETLEVLNCEIEHLGIQCLYHVLLKPCGMVLEIAYLDRSPGSQVNIYRIPLEAEGIDPRTLNHMIYLLYRPGHYDIIYPHPPAPTRAPVQMPAPTPLDVQINDVSHPHHQEASHDQNNYKAGVFSDGGVDFTALSLIPGLELTSVMPPLKRAAAMSPMGPLGILTAPSPEPYSPIYWAAPTPSPQSPFMATPFTEALPIRQGPHPLNRETSTPSLRAGSVVSQSAGRRDDSIRFSAHCHPQVSDNYTSHEQPDFITSTFKNSHYNPAHFNNPNFQPEEWKPSDMDDSSCETGKPASKRKRRSH